MTDAFKPTSPASTLDPMAMAQQWLSLGERGQKVLADFLARKADNGWQQSLMSQSADAFQTVMKGWAKDPSRLLAASFAYWQDMGKLWQEAGKRLAGGKGMPIPNLNIRDKRFSDADWQQNAAFDFIRQSYLLTTGWVNDMIRDTPGLDAKTKSRVGFYTRQWCDAISPSNFWLTNPEALRKMAETGGESLLQGFKNLLQDIERGDGDLRITMTDAGAFKLGETLATTPGQVVYRNELMELIQYNPTTPSVHKTPMLIIPPWINKYYILDLREKNSFVRHALAAGHTVFMISWINPDERHAEINFEHYMRHGPLDALDVIDSICGTTQTNITGYCLGGTLLASCLAHLHHTGQQARVASATYLVTMVDFSEPGDLGVFVDEAQIDALEQHMFRKGYLEASAMATTFNLLRANDLIWSFVVNNYLLGREPLPFDLLFWNADATRMPAAMHAYYLREMYLNNRLVRPNSLKMLGSPLDLSKITTPTFMLSTRDDHIAPWKSTYAATQIYKGPVEFVLAGSGHIAGVINPPSATKYGYWTNANKPADPEAWLKGATEHTGSWWPHWSAWLETHGGSAMIPARQPGSPSHPPIEAAPGSYVKVRAA